MYKYVLPPGHVDVVFLPGDDSQNPVMPLVFSRCGSVCTRYVAHRCLFGTPDSCCRCCVRPVGVTARSPRKALLFTSTARCRCLKLIIGGCVGRVTFMVVLVICFLCFGAHCQVFETGFKVCWITWNVLGCKMDCLEA